MTAGKRGWLARRLWPEPPEEREYRLGRFFITAPMGLVLGTSFGILAAIRWGLPGLSSAVEGGVGGLLVMYLLGQIESLAAALTDARGARAGLLVRLGVDILAGILFGRLFSVVLDANGLALLAIGASILVTYSAVATRFFLGGWAEGLVNVITGQVGGPRPHNYSYADSLVARGLAREAEEEYEIHCEESPGDPDPPLHAAWAFRQHGDWRRALVWFRRALDAPRIDARRSAVAVRQIHEISLAKLDDPSGAAADLEMVVHRFPDAEELAWARRELDALGEAP